MGSDKSGTWLGPEKKIRVDECLRLTVSDLRESGLIKGKADEVLFSWKTGEAETDMATVRANVTSRSATRISVCLAYTAHINGEPHKVSETIHVVKADRKDGANWWIQCPARVNGEACSRRVGVLYLAPGERYFVCRHCYDLAYPWSKKSGQSKGDEMDETRNVQRDDEGRDNLGRPAELGQTVGEAPTSEPSTTPPPLRSSFYIDHGMRLLASETTTLKEAGRVKLVDELLARMLQDAGLPDSRFSRVISEIQCLAPKAFAACATKALRDGNFSVGPEDMGAYFPLQRMGHVLRLHLIEDLQIERAADLLLVDTAIAAFVQARILLSRATPLSPYNGPPPDQEKLYRSQATVQQKLFLAAMSKLQPKPARPIGRPPTKASA